MSGQAANAEAIGVLRRRVGWKQKDLAAKANISIAHMSRIERGETDPRRPTLQKLTAALGLSLAEFFRFSEELAKSRSPEFASPDQYPPLGAGSRRQPDTVAEEEKRLEYFYGLEEEDPES